MWCTHSRRIDPISRDSVTSSTRIGFSVHTGQGRSGSREGHRGSRAPSAHRDGSEEAACTGDDEYPIIQIQTPGFLSLVIPNFGLGPVDFDEAYLTEIQPNGRWKEVTIASMSPVTGKFAGKPRAKPRVPDIVRKENTRSHTYGLPWDTSAHAVRGSDRDGMIVCKL